MENTDIKTLKWLKTSFEKAKNEHKLTKKKMAEDCGVSQQAVNKWFKTGQVDKKHFTTLIKLLGSTPTWMDKTQNILETPGIYEYTGAQYIDSINTNYKRVPVVGMAKLGDNGYFEDQQFAVGFGDGYIDHPTKDINAYALKTVGDSMHPTIRHGWFVIIEPNLEFYSNMIALVKMNDGRKMIKEVVKQDDGFYTLHSVNAEHERITVHQSEIEDIQPVGGIIPPNKVVYP